MGAKIEPATFCLPVQWFSPLHHKNNKSSHDHGEHMNVWSRHSASQIVPHIFFHTCFKVVGFRGPSSWSSSSSPPSHPSGLEQIRVLSNPSWFDNTPLIEKHPMVFCREI